ncbi:MAG: FAD-dependent oxidoreductase, partial [Myxococcales bacterium]
MSDRREFDFLVLGSGIAGLFYALRVAQHGSVGIVTKKRAADSATNWAQGGIAAVMSADDTFESHARDTLEAGAGLCHPEVVNFVVERGPAMIDALTKLGTDFDPAGDQGGRLFDLGRAGGHSHRRILHHRDATGQEIERVLLARARAHPNIDLFEN